MTAIHTGSDYAELDGKALGQLSFRWTGDRFQHGWRFAHTGPDRDACEIESVESDHSVHWPVSPPIQQVYRQHFVDGREVMFAVGMSGRSHWSVSFTLVPDLHSWIVELACCSPTEPPLLASSYRLHGRWQLDSSPSGSGQVLECQTSGVKIESLSPLTTLQLDGDQLVIRPESIVHEATTIQWGFRIRVAR
ncbi:MAG: hypothetical protein KF752_00430 [Pirellulaceae bacterium]|nr:hypothetical protein [Pirellulaceae bacterium]